jgi:hypothetical protein
MNENYLANHEGFKIVGDQISVVILFPGRPIQIHLHIDLKVNHVQKSYVTSMYVIYQSFIMNYQLIPQESILHTYSQRCHNF